MSNEKTATRWQRWIHPGKISYTSFEWVIMRLLFAYLLFLSFRYAGFDVLHWGDSPGRGADFMTQPKPRGIAQFVDVTWINQAANIPRVAAAVAILLVLFVIGLTPVISSLGLAFLHIVLGTLENSQGNNVWHTSQILVFVLLGIGISGIVENVRAFARGGIGGLKERAASRFKWAGRVVKNPSVIFRKPADSLEEEETAGRSQAIYFVQQLMATAYVVSGISKMWISKGQWFTDVQFIGLQFDKNRLLKYYQTLKDPDVIRWAPEAVNAHPGLASFFFSIGLLLEIGCFVALFNRSLLAVFGIGLIAMHLLIAMIMTLDFYFNEFVLAIFYVNVPFWLMLGLRKLKKVA